MEQLSFDFVQDHVTHKEFSIHSRLPIKRMQRGYNLVHVSFQKNFDIRAGDTVNVTATERRTELGKGHVTNVWRGKLKDLPATWLREHESGLTTFDALQDYLYPARPNELQSWIVGYMDDIVAVHYRPFSK